MRNIRELRESISDIDVQITNLLQKRAEIAKQIGEIKTGQGEEQIYDPSRQKLLMDNVLGAVQGFLTPEGLKRIFTEISSQCQQLEQKIKVGFLGPEGTYTHQASVAEFGSSVNFIPFSSVDDLFSAVEKKIVDCSVVAIENSTGGVVHKVLDRFLDSDVKISSEIIIYIHHCLISNVDLDKVECIFSHPQPFMQCRHWLRENLPSARHVEVASTVEGVHKARETKNSAAIASEIAANRYKMKILAKNIQDTMENFTRFVVLGRTVPKPTGSDKTSLIVSLKHKPGSLFEALKPFAARGVNLTKIESRPTRQRPWEYVFFIDFEGHLDDKKVKGVLKELEPHTVFIQCLGSYPNERMNKQ